jgi:hypothetical protein
LEQVIVVLIDDGDFEPRASERLSSRQAAKPGSNYDHARPNHNLILSRDVSPQYEEQSVISHYAAGCTAIEIFKANGVDSARLLRMTQSEFRVMMFVEQEQQHSRRGLGAGRRHRHFLQDASAGAIEDPAFPTTAAGGLRSHLGLLHS